MKKSLSTRDKDEKYRSIFEHSAVSLWEEDISRLRSRLRELRADDGFSLRAHLAAHPEFVQEAVGLVEVTDVNRASLRLFEAARREQLAGPLSTVLDAVSRAAMVETILAIDEGTSDIEQESTALTLKGRRLSLIVKAHIPPADAAYPSMLVSLIDITARKEAEDRERRSAFILHSIIDSSPDSIFVKDSSLRMVLCNTALAHAIGKEPEDTYGKSDIENGWSVDLVKGNPEKGIVGWEKDDLAALSGGTVHVAAEPSDFDKGIRYYDTTKFPLRDPDGSVIGLVGIGRDVTDQKEKEAQLRASEERYRNLIELAADGILVLDKAGNFVMVNSTLCGILGYDRETLLGMNLLDTYPDDMRDVGQQRIDQLKAGQSLRFERPMKRMDGSHIDVEVSARGLENGGMQGIMHDITERKRLEADLAWERGLFTLLMDNLPDQIYFKDSMSRFIRASKSHARVLGLDDPSQEMGKTDADFFSEAHARKALEDERRIISTGEPLVDVEERLTYPGRPDTWAITTKMPLRDPAGKVVGTFGISHDITARKQLEENNRLFATLVESADDAIVGIGLDLKITAWNKGAERLYGYSSEEIIGASISLLVPPELEHETRTLGERLSHGEELSHFETMRLRKDGTRVVVSLTLAPIRDGSGRIIGTAAVGRDVTEQKAIQAQLYRAQRLESLATLAAGVAHQFNNINTVVGGYLQMLQMEKELPTRAAGYVEAARSAVQKAVDITDRLLALTGSAGGSADTPRLDDLARVVLPLYEPRIAAEKVRIVLNLVETPPVRGDESRLRFVLSSLLGNALDALVDRPVRMVSIRTGCAKDAVYFEIEDSGCGIPEPDLPRIFSPFYSGKGEWAPTGSPQSKLKGVGLSLAISSATISEYGGRIDVQSTSGAGSTFRVVMPLSRPVA
jgi:PAS domain S-box-containing protein